MRAILLGAAAALGLFPAIASAAVVVKIGDLPVMTVAPLPTAQTIPVDVWIDTGGATLTGAMDAFTISFEGKDFGNGVKFVHPSNATFDTTEPLHPYVFTGKNAPPGDAGGDDKTALVFGALATGTADVHNRDGLVRLPVLIPANPALGSKYHVSIDPNLFSLGGPAPELASAVPGSILEIQIVPEPASFGLIGLGAVLFLRRRRVA